MAITGEEAKVAQELEANVEWLNKELGVKESFDVIRRDIIFAGRRASLFYIDGFIKDDIMLYILRRLSELEREDLAPSPFKKTLQQYINYIEVDTLEDLHQVVDKVLAGGLALVVDGFAQVIIIDARRYPARNPEEPDLERVVRGSRDGFVETLLYNTNLLRRRIRDPRLRIEVLQAGSRSKTDIALAYIKDIAHPRLVEEVKRRIKAIKIDGLPMAEKSVEELITPGNWWNPFPRVRYTERPDVAAVHLLEGHILVMVDTSPSVMIIPATFFHHLQHAEEYRQVPLVGAFLRWIRFLGMMVSVFLPPVWLLLALNRDLIPPGMEWLGPKKIAAIPLVWQFILAEGGIDLLRMAAVHTPTALATALGLIATILIGEVAIAVGLFNPEVILYMAVAAIGIFATPSYELGMANTLVRVIALLAVGFWGLPGLVAILLGTFLLLATTKSFGVPYLWPLIPWDWRSLKSILLRSPVPLQNLRPPILKPLDEDRQPAPAYKPLPWEERETLEKRASQEAKLQDRVQDKD